jgi:hypothetical protein
MDRGAVQDYAAPKVVDHSVVQVLDGRGNRKRGSIWNGSMARMDRGAVHDKAAPKVVDHSVVQVLDGRGNRKSDSIRSLGKDGMDRGAVHDCAALPLRDAWDNPGRDVGR